MESPLLLPTSFDPHDPNLSAHAHPTGGRWSSVEAYLQEIRPTILVMRLPLFWQLEIPLWQAAQRAGASLFVNDKDNNPLGASAIKNGVDVIVTDAADAAVFAEYLLRTNSPMPRAWVVVHPVSATHWELPLIVQSSKAAAYQEVHRSPGIPILTQCAALAAEKTSHFHTTEENVAEAYPLMPTGICTCGLPIVERKAHA